MARSWTFPALVGLREAGQMAEPVVIDPTDFDAVGVLTEAIVSLRAHVLISEDHRYMLENGARGWPTRR